jgi:hypothetical protein
MGILFALGKRSVSGLLGGGPSGGGSGNEVFSSKTKPSVLSDGGCRWFPSDMASSSLDAMGCPNASKVWVIFSKGSSVTVGKPECGCCPWEDMNGEDSSVWFC